MLQAVVNKRFCVRYELSLAEHMAVTYTLYVVLPVSPVMVIRLLFVIIPVKFSSVQLST